MKRFFLVFLLLSLHFLYVGAQTVNDVLPSYNDARRNVQRSMQYQPKDDAFVSENGTNRFTRALYGGYTDYRIETSDVPIFAVAKKGQYKSVRFEVAGVPLDSADYCKSWYHDGMRSYILGDHPCACGGASRC